MTAYHDHNLSTFQSSLDRFGFAVVRNIFSPSEIINLRKHINYLKGTTSAYTFYNSSILKGDIFSFPCLAEFSYFLYHRRFSNVVRTLLGESPTYFGESNIHIGIGIRGYHKDCRYENRDSFGPDYQSDYDLYRFAIYLQDSDVYSGGVKVYPGSHKIPSSRFKSGGLNVKSKSGDLVIWKLPTTHSGNAVRLKLFPDFSFHPRVENFIPNFLAANSPLERMSIFIVLGKKGHHLDRYLNYFVTRDDNIDSLQYNGKPVLSISKSSRVGLDYSYLQPTNSYSSLCSV